MTTTLHRRRARPGFAMGTAAALGLFGLFGAGTAYADDMNPAPAPAPGPYVPADR
jgi:hypothetical protein